MEHLYPRHISELCEFVVFRRGARSTRGKPTFEGMNDEIDLIPDHMFLQLLGPKVLAGETLQSNSGVEIAGGLLGEDAEFILRV